MKKTKIFNGLSLLLVSAILLSCSKENELSNQALGEQRSNRDYKALTEKESVNATVSVFASGIVYPRGLKFGPDGYLYVATAGLAGTNSTAGQCPFPVLSMVQSLGGYTSKVLKISATGTVSTVADKLPSAINGFGDTQGAADIDFVGNTLYVLVVAGCSHGTKDYPSSIVKVNADGSWSVIADLSTYLQNNPVAAPEADDFEPDGSWYSLLNVRGDLYVVEPNHGELDKVTTSGNISRVLDFSALYGHIVPTAMAYHGNFYIGNLGTFPLVEGGSNIYKVTPSGESKIWASGFKGILGVAFDKENRLYVLETSAAGFPSPGTGKVTRINSNNSRETIVDNLTFPTGMTFGPDGALYISDTGFGPPTGRILKVTFNSN